MYSETLTIDVDETAHGWEIALRFDAESMEAAWEFERLGDVEAEQIGRAVVASINADKKRNPEGAS